MFTKQRQAITVVLIFLIGLLGFSAFAFAAKTPEIRVQLQANVNLAEVTVVAGEFDVIDGATGDTLGEAEEGDICYLSREGLTLKVTGLSRRDKGSQGGPLYFEPQDDEDCLFSVNNVTYRGGLTVQNTDRGMVLVNSLPVEEYLYGVVGQEMGYGAPEEALKSQAVASRSYAMKKLGSGLYSDLTLWSQTYKGYNAESVTGFEKVKDAVDATEGEVVCYDGTIIDAVFHSNSGGYTEASENIWQYPVPYLKAVASPTDAYAQSFSYQDAKGWPASCYQWSMTLTRDELGQCIANWNAARPGDVINIGEITNIKLSRVDSSTGEETVSGRVTAITLVGTLGEKVIEKDAIRSFFKVNGSILKSTLFDVDLSYSTYSPYSSYIPYLSSITINGRGNGHGLGLSQWGARGLADEQGYEYGDILCHYYSGVDIEDLY